MAPGKPLSDVTANVQPNEEAPSPVYRSEPGKQITEAPSPVYGSEPEKQITESISIEVPVPSSPQPEFSLLKDLTTVPLPLPLLPTTANQSFLSDLFEDGFLESGTLEAKLDKILQNQQVLFTLMSKLLGVVNSIGQVGLSLPVGEVSSRGLEKEVLRNQGKDCEVKDTGVERKFEPLESIGEESTITPLLSEDDSNMLGEVDGEEESEIIKIKGGSYSMGNFSVRLVKRFFLLVS